METGVAMFVVYSVIADFNVLWNFLASFFPMMDSSVDKLLI